ncbi:MAG TPA: TetR/AcrR family transcriptional regulator [Chloroflexaceae bacterium]|nr:TetR/AcrR family transcriptional regulator [Chloroflexaceae bacterium]
MKQARKERQQAAIREEIKAMARAHMARDGAAALSLRAVASDLGLSSAAIYYYYANRDALITALIIDAYRALAAALRGADPGPAERLDDRLFAVMRAYRAWALATPAEFELIFGAPIPGYHAPAEVTAPEARAALHTFGELFGLAFAEGRLRPPAEGPPATVAAHIEAWGRDNGQAAPPPVMLAMLQAWSVGHGMVALELNGQLQPLIGDPGPFYDYSLGGLLRSFGLAPAPAE